MRLYKQLNAKHGMMFYKTATMWKKLTTEKQINDVIRSPRLLIEHIDERVTLKEIDWADVAKMETFIVKHISIKNKTVDICCRKVEAAEGNNSGENLFAMQTKSFNEILNEGCWWYYDVYAKGNDNF